MVPKPLWTCPKCGERFVLPEMWHSCGRYSMAALFARSKPHVLRIFERLAEAARASGPVRIYAQKTRVVMQVRIRFAGGQPQTSRFMAGFLLPPDIESDRFLKRDQLGSRSYVSCIVPLDREQDVDREVRRFMKLAYRIGCQDHLKT